MADLATYRAVQPVTIKNGATALVRGVRVSRASDGTHAVQDASERGDYVTLTPIAANEFGAACRLSDGDVPLLVLAGVTVADGDDLYTAAGGAVTNVSTNAIYIGKARQAAAASGLTVATLKSVN